MARDSPLTPQFEELVGKVLAEWHVPGLSVAVVHGDEVFSAGYGIAKYPNTPVEPSTLFFAGSTTKAFVGAAWANYIESEENQRKGKARISYDTPLSSIIRDDFVLADEYVTANASIEDALSHRTGIAAHDTSYGGSIDTVQKVVRNMRHLPLVHKFRTKFGYSNIMYVAACHALQTITSKPLAQILRDDFWQPLDMRETVLSLKDAQEIDRQGRATLAVGYHWSSPADEKAGTFVAEDYMGIDYLSGAGGVVSNVLDYAKWLKALINKTSPLSEELHRQMIYPRIIQNFNDEPFTGCSAYGLGWNGMIYRGHRLYMHGGGLVAFGTWLGYFPDLKLGITMMANSLASSNRAEEILVYHLIDNILGIPADERFDFAAKERNAQKGLNELAQNALQKLYPNATTPPLAPSLPLPAYSGTYTHPGYQILTVSLMLSDSSPLNVPQQASQSSLHLDLGKRAWPYALRAEHVSGEFWIAYLRFGEPPVESPFRMQFRIGVDARPHQLGIALEPSMPEVLIWFEKQ